MIANNSFNPQNCTQPENLSVNFEIICQSQSNGFVDENFVVPTFELLQGIVIDIWENIIFSDSEQGICKLDLKSKKMTRMKMANIANCTTLTISNKGTLFALDDVNKRVSCIYIDSQTQTLYPYHRQQHFASMQSNLENPVSAVVDNDEKYLYVVDCRIHVIKRLEISHADNIQIFCGDPAFPGFEDGIGERARFHYPLDIAKNKMCSKLYIADNHNDAIRSVHIASKTVKTILKYSQSPNRLFVDRNEDIFFSTPSNLLKFSQKGQLTSLLPESASKNRDFSKHFAL